MRKRFRLALAATAVAAVTVATVAPVGAQGEPEGLGLAVDKTQAPPDARVVGQVDTGDVAERCTTSTEGIQRDVEDWVLAVLAPEAEDDEIWQRFFPGEDALPLGDLESFDQAAYATVALLTLGIILDLEGAAGTFLEQTFVLTFVDTATEDPVGEPANFDPATGDGSVIVPDVDPGFWAVAAACVTPTHDVPTVIAAIEAGGDYLENLGIPLDELPLSLGDLPALTAFLDEHGPVLLQPMMIPDATGAVLSCVLDSQGKCPDGTPPPPPGVAPGEQPPGEELAPAQPVIAEPSFTG